LYIKIVRFLDEQGFQRSPLDSNLYVKSIGNDIILLVIYVYDIIITGSEASVIEQIKSNISKDFNLIDLGLLHYYVGVEVWQTCSNIFVSQTKFTRSLVNRLRMTDCKISSTPMETWSKLSTKTLRKLMS
jgi:hypothetical protein